MCCIGGKNRGSFDSRPKDPHGGKLCKDVVRKKGNLYRSTVGGRTEHREGKSRSAVREHQGVGKRVRRLIHGGLQEHRHCPRSSKEAKKRTGCQLLRPRVYTAGWGINLE